MKTHFCQVTLLGVFLVSVLSTSPFPGSAIAQSGPALAGCPVFPADNVWNTPIDHLPVHPNSSAYINTIGPTRGVHPDFGSGLWDGGPIGIPYNIVPGSQSRVPITFDYEDESDPGPYPIPPGALIEGGSQSTGDRHVLVLDKDNCILYEIFSAYPQPGGSWSAGSGAVFDLRSDALRPTGWTSADAAGLPILSGLVRYDEVAFGEIRHALRFTAPQTKREFVWPARHYASNLTGANYPPMGQRFRLKANVNISGFSPEVQTILQALKKYGMILADNGSAWYISGVPDSHWDNDVLVSELGQVKGSDFEAVEGASLMVNPDSAQAVGGVDDPPFGFFDIPGPNAAVSGTVQVGGWALDDVGVTKVELRSSIPFWPYIGDLYYTCGTRPDIEALFANYPNSDCAGWGYMWLTNFMTETIDPQTGQRLEGSTHQFYLRIYDTAGHFADIGHRNITITNDGDQNPFGAMDIPAAGEVLSGPVNVAGWALAKGGRRVTQAQVRLDGVVIGQATYGINWPDLSQIFPVSDYPYSENAAFSYVLDTTPYSSGRHALDVAVIDEAGNLSGVGSRWISIQN